MTTPPPRSKGRPAARGSKVGSEKVVLTTKDLVMSQRPHMVTRAEIAKTLGVDQKLIRYYYPDLEVLLDEALDLGVLELDERMAAASEKGKTQSEVLASRVSALASYVAENPGYFRTLVERIYNGKSDYALKRLVVMTRNAYRRHEAMIVKGQENEEFRDVDARFLYIAILGMVEIFVTAQPVAELLFAGETKDLQKRYEKFIIDLILRGILAKTSPPAE